MGCKDMANSDNKSCRGCLCLNCEYSEHNGDIYRCPYKACRLCSEDIHHIRSICDKGKLVETHDIGDIVI